MSSNPIVGARGAASASRRAVYRRAKRAALWFDDAATYAIFRYVLAPVGQMLPLTVSRRIAIWIGNTLAVLSVRARAENRDLAKTHPGWRESRAGLARSRIAQKCVDFVAINSYAGDRTDPLEWDVHHTNRHLFYDALAKWGSVIVVTGHFARESCVVFYHPNHLPGRFFTIVADVPEPTKDPSTWLVPLRYSPMLTGIVKIRNDESALIRAESEASVFRRVVKTLREPGSLLLVLADAPQDVTSQQGVLVRPFAGKTSAGFAFGAARISRMSQRPIVVCVPVVEGVRRVRVDWGLAFDPPERNASEQDELLTNKILDYLEREVGERPLQYMLAIGNRRSWSRDKRCWTNDVLGKT